MFIILFQSLVLLLALRVSSSSWDEIMCFDFRTSVAKPKLFSIMEIIPCSLCESLHRFRIDCTIASDISRLISTSLRASSPLNSLWYLFSALVMGFTSAHYLARPHPEQAIIVSRSFTIRSNWISSRAETTIGMLQKSCNLFIRS